jgi:hypothetical protein
VELERETRRDDTPRRWFRREAISLGELLVQTFAVVLGILLALGIDDWKKDREETKSIADAIAAIHTEVDSNRKALAVQRTHLRDGEAAMAKVTVATPLPCNAYDNWEGTGIAFLSNAAYQTAIATQAFTHLRFDDAQAIAGSYSRQAMYSDYVGKVVDVLLRAEPMEPSSCGGLLHELGGFADSLDASYARTLDVTAANGAH